MNIPPDRKADVIVRTSDPMLGRLIESESVHIRTNARVEKISVDGAYSPARTDASAVFAGGELFVPLKGLIDMDRERARLEKEIARIQGDLAKTEAKLGNESFTSRAPREVIDKEVAKRDELATMLEMLGKNLSKLS
jgi:valyl-tRNA synthetase